LTCRALGVPPGPLGVAGMGMPWKLMTKCLPACQVELRQLCLADDWANGERGVRGRLGGS